MVSLIHFRVTPEKWLESACSVLILCDLLLAFGLYDDIGAVGARVYAGRFTLLKSDFILLKPLSNLRTQYASFLISNEPIGGGGFNPKYKIPYIRVYPIKNTPSKYHQ